MSWSCAAFNHRLESSIPQTSGIYAYMKVKRYYGLPENVEHLYVGKSTNLRNRFIQHLHQLEPNPIFKEIQKATNVEFWWLKVPVEQLDSVERALIQSLAPIGNTVGKKGGKCS